MPFGFADTFEIQPPNSGSRPPSNWLKVAENSDWQKDEARKKLFGIELTQHPTAFEAACAIFKDTTQALWVSQNWLNDPTVLASKSAYNQATNLELLDKQGLSRKLLDFAEEKDLTGRFYISEAKDRLAALKLYAEVQGYIGKVDINPTLNNTTNNIMKIMFVKPEHKNDNQKTIEHSIEEQPKLKLPIKLVSSH